MRRQPRHSGPAERADRAVEWTLEHTRTRRAHRCENDGEQRVRRANDDLTSAPRR
jgi:hypothetical protein